MSIKHVIDRIIEVAEWDDSLVATQYNLGQSDFARELREMLDDEPAPEYSQREVLVIETAARLAISNNETSIAQSIEWAQSLLDAFDASREVKP